jgi:hypothetical protein
VKGLVVIGVTNEDPELVDAFVQTYQPTYPIVITGNEKFDKVLGVKGFPTEAVMDPKGDLVYSGYSAGSALKGAMAKAKRGSLYPKKLGKAMKQLRAGDIPASYAEVKKLAAGTMDEELASWVNRFAATLEQRATDDLAAARKLAEEGRVYQAHTLVASYKEAKVAFPNAQEAHGFLAEVEALPLFKDEMKAGPLYAGATGHDKDHNYLDAIAAYKKVYKKYPDTQAGSMARQRVEEIVEQGLPGYERSCNLCRQFRKACDRHLEKVKM